MTQRKNFPLRLSPSLYRAIQRMADQELRSVNGQIEFLLRQAVRDAGLPLDDDSDKPPGGKSPSKKSPGSSSD